MKRFTDNLKWQKHWFRKMPPEYKCFWYYLTESCDGAGVWEPDFGLVRAFIGKKVEAEKALNFFNNGKIRIVILENGDWYLPDFISFQYGELSDACPAHKPVFKLLKKHNLPDRVSRTLQEKDKEKYKEKDKDKDKKFQKPTLEEITLLIEEAKYIVDPEAFFNFYESKGWKVGNQPMKDWKAAVRTWQHKEKDKTISSKYGNVAAKNKNAFENFNKQMENKTKGYIDVKP